MFMNSFGCWRRGGEKPEALSIFYRNNIFEDNYENDSFLLLGSLNIFHF